MFVKTVAERLHATVTEFDGMADFICVWDYEHPDNRKTHQQNADQVRHVANDRGYFTRMDIDLNACNITLRCKY